MQRTCPHPINLKTHRLRSHIIVNASQHDARVPEDVRQPLQRGEGINGPYSIVNDELFREGQRARQESLDEYEALKALLLKRTWRFGTLFSVYLLLAVSTESAFAELIGAATSYGYVLWLIRDIDAYGPDTQVPMRTAEALEQPVAKFFAKLIAGYRQSLTPRLLIPVGLVAGCAAWNTLVPEFQLSIVDEGCMLGGFLSFKIALVLKIYDDLKPRALTEEEMLRASRPQLADIEDVPLRLRGRKQDGDESDSSDD